MQSTGAWHQIYPLSASGIGFKESLLKNILILEGNLFRFWFFILGPPFVNLVGKVHKAFWQEYYHQNQEYTDNDVTAECKPGHFQPFPDNGEDDGTNNRAGKGAQAT
jgi:hypothetical protein